MKLTLPLRHQGWLLVQSQNLRNIFANITLYLGALKSKLLPPLRHHQLASVSLQVRGWTKLKHSDHESQ
jgi:hypothetical protein